jgi:hypothetical protein
LPAPEKARRVDRIAALVVLPGDLRFAGSRSKTSSILLSNASAISNAKDSNGSKMQKWLAEECLPEPIVAMLRARGDDVRHAAENIRKRQRMKRLALAAALAASGCIATPAVDLAPAFAGDPACAIDPADRDWLTKAPGAWALVEHGAFGLQPAARQPAFILFDRVCAYRSADGVRWVAEVHGGEVKLPDGDGLPPQVASFAAAGEDASPFMVMALPTIWRAGAVTSEMGLENMMFAVFAHEMAHTRQFDNYNARFDRIAEVAGLGDDFNDDVVQDRFGADAEFAASVARERELLFLAAEERDVIKAKALAREALELVRVRQARWFTGDKAAFAELEDVFLTLEGVGQYAGYSWLTNARGGGFSHDVAVRGMRRGGRRWSQDEGFGIFLALDRLDPDWPDKAFRTPPRTALEMLALAARQN